MLQGFFISNAYWVENILPKSFDVCKRGPIQTEGYVPNEITSHKS